MSGLILLFICLTMFRADQAWAAEPLPAELLEETEGEKAAEDDSLLAASHLSEIYKWPGVAEKDDGGKAVGRWARAQLDGYPGRIFTRPGAGANLETAVEVPKRGRYRIWLGYFAGPGEAHPVTLSLDGANSDQHVFGAVALPQTGGPEVETALPVRFDSDRERDTYPVSKAVVWEYWDAELDAGRTVLALSCSDRSALLDAIFVTLSRQVVPGGSRVVGRPGTFNRIYYRFRLSAGDKNVKDAEIAGGCAYIVPPTTKGPYHAQFGKITSCDGKARVPVGEWSAWLDATEATATMGSYVNVGISIKAAKGVEFSGRLEVQNAWHAHSGAVLDTLSVPVSNGHCAFLAPAFWERMPTPACPALDQTNGTPFAVRSLAESQRLRTHRKELQSQIARIPEEALKPGIMPKRIQIITLARVPESDYDLAIPLLKKTGFNLICGISQEAKREHGLHLEDFKPAANEIYELQIKLAERYGPLLARYEPGKTVDADVEAFARRLEQDKPGYRDLAHWHPMGDEIGPAVSQDSVNGNPLLLARFRDYLRAASSNGASFFGAPSFDRIEFTGEPASGMSRFERRLYYHSAVYRWQATAEYYGKTTDVLRRIFPNILTMANYSPYTVFYYGSGMDHGQNSFALPRANACTGHWGEDWLPHTGIASIAGVQTESFLASVLRCGAGRYGQRTGMYIVWKLGELDRKMGLAVSHGLKTLYIYYWGPRYIGGGSPESSSHRAETYAQINRAARALGPADEIIAEGRREPALVALLYNRTAEMWNQGCAWARTDRIYTFLALRHAHLPVDLVLEDDLTEGLLSQFRVLFLNGAHIRRAAVAPIRRWVEQGGLLYAAGPVAIRDEYDDPLPEAEALLGARQRPGGESGGSQEAYQPLLCAHQPIDTVVFDESEFTPALTARVVGVKTILVPAEGATTLARYADGSCAAAARRLGKGAVVLLGVMPGYLYAHNAPRDANDNPVNYTAERRALVAKAALAAAPPTVIHSEPLLEVVRFDHSTGIAVMVTDLSYKPGTPGILTVRTDRQLKEVSASLAGPLKWKRNGDSIEIECPAPDALDAVILR